MKTIQLTQGKVALVDDADYERVVQYKWYASISQTLKDGTQVWYARRNAPRSGGGQVTQRMHRFILGVTDPAQQVDHLDGDELNNQRTNMRVVNQSLNQRNRRAHRAGRLVGVSLDKHVHKRPWVAHIQLNGHYKHLGMFATEREAHEQYLFARGILDMVDAEFERQGI